MIIPPYQPKQFDLDAYCDMVDMTLPARCLVYRATVKPAPENSFIGTYAFFYDMVPCRVVSVNAQVVNLPNPFRTMITLQLSAHSRYNLRGEVLRVFIYNKVPYQFDGESVPLNNFRLSGYTTGEVQDESTLTVRTLTLGTKEPGAPY